MVLGTHGRVGVFDFIFWPFKVNSAFWRGRALHSIVVTSPWPGEEHSREVANSNEKKNNNNKGGGGGGDGRWALDGWIRKGDLFSPAFSDPVT